MSDFFAHLAPSLAHTLAAVFGPMTDEQIAVLLAGLLVLAGFVCIAALVMRTLRCIGQIRSATAVLQTARDKAQFAQTYDVIAGKLETSRLICEAWLRFTGTLVFPQIAGAADTSIKCTGEPKDYFTPGAIGERWRDYRAMPSLFLSVALLLTVVGFVGTMSSALKAVDSAAISQPQAQAGAGAKSSADAQGALIERARDGLRRLVDAGGVNLTIAISGLLISLLISLTIRTCASSLRMALQGFIDALERRIVLVSFETLVLDRLDSVGAGVGAPAGAEPTGRQVARALELALPAHLDAAMTKLLASVESTSGKFASANQATAADLSETFSKLIDDRVAQPMRGMSAAMQIVRAKLDGLEGVVGDVKTSTSAAAAAAASLASGSREPAGDQLEVTRMLLAIEQGQDMLADANKAALQDLSDSLVKRLEFNVASPMRDMAAAMSEMRGKIDEVEWALTSQKPVAALALAAPAAAPRDDQLPRLLAAMEANSTEVAAANRAAIQQMTVEFGRRLDAELAHPMRGVSATMTDIREKLASVAETVERTSATSATAAELTAQHVDVQNAIAALRQALDDSRIQGGGTNQAAAQQVVQGLVRDLAGRLDAGFAASAKGASAEIGELRNRLAAMNEAIERTAGSGVSAADLALSDAELRSTVAELRRALDDGMGRLSGDLRDQARDQNQQLVSELANRMDGLLAHPIRDVSEAMAEIRGKLAVVSDLAARPVLTSSQDGPAQDEKLKAAVAELRRALEDGNARIATANRVAMQDVTQAFIKRLDERVAAPVQGLGEAIGDVRAKVLEVQAALAGIERMGGGVQSAVVSAPVSIDISEQRAELERLLATLLSAIEQGNDKVVGSQSAAIRELADDFAVRVEDHVASPVRELAQAVARLEVELPAAYARVDSQAADNVSLAAKDVRSAVAELGAAISAMTVQAQDECELARNTLIEQINRSIEDLAGATRGFDENSHMIAARLDTALEKAPAALTREAESAARAFQTATESARIHLEKTVAELAISSRARTEETTAALTKASEQLVRQASHAQEAIKSQLANTVIGIERATGCIDLAYDKLNASLAKGTQGVSADILAQLAAASGELNAITKASSDQTMKSVAGIWETVNQARALIATDMERARESVAQQAEQANLDIASKLRETATEVASLMAGYGGNLSVTADTLVKTLHAVSGEMRRLEASMADQDAVHGKVAVNAGPGSFESRWQMTGRPVGPAGSSAATLTDADLSQLGKVGTDEVLGRFIESRRAFVKAVEKE